MNQVGAIFPSSTCLFRRAAVLGLCFTFAVGLAQAGDILRGGSPAGKPGRRSEGGGMTTGLERSRINAKDALARTTQHITDMKALQDAARGAALKAGNRLKPNLPTVPNGLGAGGLQVAPGVPANLANPQPGENPALWTGAKLPTQKAANGKTKVTVEQTAQQALLTWQTFNIGKETTLVFDQSKGGKDVGKWIAFNKVNDPTGVPSQILGSIKAQGQVYVMNQNGIIFGGSSQVNVHGFVASSLPINDNLLNRGVLNNPDLQFLFSSIDIPALASGGTMPAFKAPVANTPDGKSGDVVVQAGAKLTAPSNADHVGGRIALVGPNVSNAGTISTPDGQTILAAGQQVGFRAHASSDASLRGLDVFIGQVDAGNGCATNSGLIDAPRANTTIAGKTVEQLGVISSSTSVSLNGRVDLLADYNTVVSVVVGKPRFSQTATGTVTLGAGSTLSILPEWWSDETVVGTQLSLSSQVNLEGRVIHLGSDAQVLAPNANVALRSGTWLPQSGAYSFIYNGGQIYFDQGASINVGGSTDIAASITQNILSLELRGAELADSPLQREGVLRGPTLTFDIRESGTFNGLSWVGSPLGNVSGYAGLIQRTVGQLTTAGGTVTIKSGGSVIMQPGSLIDVSGGWVNFDGGMVQTSRVISGSQLLDIANATPDRIYDGIYTGASTTVSQRWGITQTFANPLALTGAHWEDGYTQGADGGSISITAPSMALDGTLRGQTVSGPRQRETGPQLSALSLLFQSQEDTGPLYYAVSPTPPKITFQKDSGLAPADAFTLDVNGNAGLLRADRLAEVNLSLELLTEAGFGKLTVDNKDGDIIVPAGVSLVAAPRGSISLSGANVNIAGNVAAPGGSLVFDVFNISPYAAVKLQGEATPVTPPPNSGRGVFTLAPGASLSTAGLVVDDRPGTRTPHPLPLVIGGGSISIRSYTAQLSEGGSVDASGGVLVTAGGEISYGAGGSISIAAGQDLSLSSVLGGHLTLDASLRGYSGTRGGALSIQAPLVQIGGATDNADTLLLTPDFFNHGGFTSFALRGLGAATGQAGEFFPAVVVAPGTVLEPIAQNWLAIPHPGDGEGVGLTITTRPQALRTPVSLALSAPGVRDAFGGAIVVRGDLKFGEGALIQTEPGAIVSLSGNTVEVLGSIVAPGGSITVSGGGNSTSLFADQTQALPTVYLGPRSYLSAAGTTVLTPNPYGHRTGYVLPGGSISVSGNIVASAGGILNVSGASDVLDVHPAYLSFSNDRPFVPASSGLTTPLYRTLAVPAKVDSNGGTISLTGAQMLFSDATLLGQAGGAAAEGGSLVVSSGRFYSPLETVQPTPLDITLLVKQGGLTLPNPVAGSAIGKAVLDANGATLPGLGYFAANRFLEGGFGSLALKGTVKFSGPVTITADRSLSLADAGVLYADSAVRLTAPYVALGTPFAAPVLPTDVTSPFTVGGQPFLFPPTFGPGSLTIRAGLIDVGNLSLQNIGSAKLIADRGDIRGNGTLDIAGDLLLRAAQVYPTTASVFTLVANDYSSGSVDHSGSIKVVGSGTRQLPLSAGGTLNLYASVIEQGGTLVAPVGTINLGWDGSGTAPKDPISGLSVATTEQLTLGANSLTSVSSIDRLSGQSILIPYGLNLNGTSWINPAGVDITAGGAPQKLINISASSIASQHGALIDLRGGGDLYAYRWAKGLGGSRDLLASSTSFAVVPGYLTNYAPYAAFNTKSNATNLGGDHGYVNSTLHVGDRVYLGASAGLPAGTYTLLPARYALLPGSFLITPKDGTPLGTVPLLGGASLVSGFRYNSLDGIGAAPLASRFEVAPASVVRAQAEYADSFADGFLRNGAIVSNAAIPRLPIDAGQLVLQATSALTLQGSVAAQSYGGRGGLVDIASPVNILIAGPGVTGGSGELVLNSAELSGFGAESLLIGGVRQSNGAVTVKTGSLTVNNAGAVLTGPEIILVANESLTLAAGAEIRQAGLISGRATMLQLSGDGTLLRVSSDVAALVVRTNVTSSNVPQMTIGAGAQVSGVSVILDSTAGTSLDPTAAIRGRAISLNSGQISLQLDDSGALPPTAGLVLAGPALQDLQSAQRLSLLSYSSIDLYGTGQFGSSDLASLSLHAAEIRGFDNVGGTVTLAADTLSLDNSPNRPAPGAAGPLSGTLKLDANVIRIGANQLAVDQFASLELNAPGGLLLTGSGGLNAQGDVAVTTPLITASRAATQGITAGGALVIQVPAQATTARVNGGLGAALKLQGASVTVDSDIILPSGALTLRATTGDVSIGGVLDVSGTAQKFFDVTKYTSGGVISLVSDHGSVSIVNGATVTVAAQSGAGNAGSLSVSAVEGIFAVDGTLHGEGGARGKSGTFALDVGSLPNTASIDATLNAAAFNESRNYRVRAGDVLIDGPATAHTYQLSADQGSIQVTNTIDASGATGGTIALAAKGNVMLSAGSRLDVSAQDFSHARKGGAVSIETRSGTIVVGGNSTIDLSVAKAAKLGDFSGTLHLRAPQTAGSTEVAIAAIDGTILGASSIIAEGFTVFNLTGSGGAITSAVQASVFNNGTLFAGNTAAMTSRLLANNAGLDSVFSVRPGAELVNLSGDLTLGTANSTATSDWNLSTFRFGPKNAPGVLTLRAAGNLVFYNALSDGFASSAYTTTLLGENSLLPDNAESWSYRLVAGADFGAADFHRVQPLVNLGATSGSLLLGKDAGTNSASSPGPNAQTSTVLGNRYQVIRTGSGDIDIAAGRDVQLLNQFATIYTAGTRVTDPTLGGTFDLPILDASGGGTALGAVQQDPAYPVQYTLGGGNVTINAGGDIVHLTRNTAGNLIADSERQLPMNWLYRRGFVDPATGQFGVARFGDVASTTWWVDFSNFFEGVGALGGGNVTMIAGHNIANVDAVIPTNARMPKGQPDATKLIELGGGDLTIRAGHDIDGGVYYVERGQGGLTAGNTIHTNSTRSPSLGTLQFPVEILAPETWLPTTLFLGKGSFDVSASGDVLMGPVANPFLLPGGFNNTFWYKTYFSTYAPTNSVQVESLGGSVTLRESATLPSSTASNATPLLQAWLQRELLLTTAPRSASFFQPWLRLNETSVGPFATVASLQPSTLRVTAFSGDINVVGALTLSPSPTGTLELAAAAINGLQPNGLATINGVPTKTWGAATINVSDANPAAVPGITLPLAYQIAAGTTPGTARTTGLDFLANIDALFRESGATEGAQSVLQAKQALHSPGVLHAGDPEPVRLYALGGDLSGLTLFSPKAARILAARDITDIAFYLQNVSEGDFSLVSSGRDIVAFNANSPLRVSARAAGNILNLGSPTLAGDIQIGGPGTLEVLAGRNLDLGVGPNNGDGTALGVVSIGNTRNPYLSFDGANIVAGAGIGGPASLGGSGLDFDRFINEVLTPDKLDTYLTELNVSGVNSGNFNALSEEEKARLALEMFYLVLRDAGRNGTIGSSSGGDASQSGGAVEATPSSLGSNIAVSNDTETGFAAIEALFPGSYQGDISLTSREFKTKSGGSISLFAPGGKLTVGFDAGGNQPLDQGIFTEAGGNISIFTDGDVVVGTSRIFTLRGGNEIIWSSNGDIAAGASAKTVQSAPPTRVIIDPQSGDVQTDLAGLATGGGIGVLATVAGVPPGDVDLIAPKGTVDAGDAGIRVSGNLNIAATQVLNASNIAVGGSSAGTPAVAVAAPVVTVTTPTATTAGANAANEQAAAQQRQQEPSAAEELPSIITVEVVGYGGGDPDEEEERRKRSTQPAPP